MAYKNTFRLIYTLLLTALLAGGNMRAMAQSSTGVVVHGNVYGGGNQADVIINTEVNISTGTVEGNVYGGGNLGDVGKLMISLIKLIIFGLVQITNPIVLAVLITLAFVLFILLVVRC